MVTMSTGFSFGNQHLGAAAMAAGHVGGGPGLVDEDDPLGIEIERVVERSLRCLRKSGRSCSTA